VDYYGPLPEDPNETGDPEPANPGVYALVRRITDKTIRPMLSTSDDPAQVMDFLKHHPATPDATPKPECSNMPH
jgi:hypothetical protein